MRRHFSGSFCRAYAPFRLASMRMRNACGRMDASSLSSRIVDRILTCARPGRRLTVAPRTGGFLRNRSALTLRYKVTIVLTT